MKPQILKRLAWLLLAAFIGFLTYFFTSMNKHEKVFKFDENLQRELRLVFDSETLMRYGMVWDVKSPHKGFEEWKDSRLASSPYLTQYVARESGNDFVDYKITIYSSRTLIHSNGNTNSRPPYFVDCHACGSLISVGAFNNVNGEWQLAFKELFVAQDGTWGNPPSITFGDIQAIDDFTLLFSHSATSTGTLATSSYEMKYKKGVWTQTNLKVTEERVDIANESVHPKR